jgi:TrmH family RNA methyltransferase
VLSLNQTKLLHALQVKKYRQKYRNFLVEGEKMVAELLQQRRFPVLGIWGLERWAAGNASLLKPFLRNFNLVTEAELRKISTLTTPNSVIAIAEWPNEAPGAELLQSDICLYLDGIQDPGNCGTILRVADWFGFPAVFCSYDTVDVFSPKVVQASMGAIFRVPAREIDLSELLENCTSAPPVMGALLGGDDLFQTALPKNGLLVIGNEGRGISINVQVQLTHRITIPRHPGGHAESLNAAVATGIMAAVLRNSGNNT